MHRRAGSVDFWAPATTTFWDQRLHTAFIQRHHCLLAQVKRVHHIRLSHTLTHFTACRSKELRTMHWCFLELPSEKPQVTPGASLLRATAKIPIPSQVHVWGGLRGEWVCMLWEHHGAPPRAECRSGRTVAGQADIQPPAHGWVTTHRQSQLLPRGLILPCLPPISPATGKCHPQHDTAHMLLTAKSLRPSRGSAPHTMNAELPGRSAEHVSTTSHTSFDINSGFCPTV